MNILFLSRWFPYPATNGSKLRIFNLLRGLSRAHAVTLVSFADEAGIQPDAPELRAVCTAVHVVPWQPYRPEGLRARLGFLAPEPRFIHDTYSPGMADCVQRVLAARPYDLVIASQVDMARYRACFAGVPALFEEVEVGTLYEQFRRAEGAAQRLRYGLTWQKHRRYLAGLLRSYQAATVVSAPERALVAEQVAGDAARLRVIANGVDVASYADVAAEPAAHTLIFAGSFSYLPNYHAMQWFIEQVFPRVRTAVPGTRLVITGRHGDRPLPSLDGVELTGFVDDVRPRIKGAWLSVAPIWIGGGTRLKILEAMALGTPVVATHKGAEGLDLVNGRDIVLADEPAAFADAVIGLLRDPAARQALAARGLQRVREVYDWQVILPQFMGLVAETAVAANGRTG